jgi:hypothetical protein
MKIIFLIILSVALTSCMHLGMMGTHGEQQKPPQSLLEKEVVVGNIRATGSFPALKRGEEAVLSLRLVDRATGNPLSGATVSFHAEYIHQPDQHNMGHMQHGDSTRIPRKEEEHAISFDREVPESSTPGMYSVQFTPSQSGKHQLMFHISEIDREKLESEIIVEVERDVADSHRQHSSGMMHGFGGASDYLLIGGAIMGAMMVIIWATGGRMF